MQHELLGHTLGVRAAERISVPARVAVDDGAQWTRFEKRLEPGAAGRVAINVAPALPDVVFPRVAHHALGLGKHAVDAPVVVVGARRVLARDHGRGSVGRSARHALLGRCGTACSVYPVFDNTVFDNPGARYRRRHGGSEYRVVRGEISGRHGVVKYLV